MGMIAANGVQLYAEQAGQGDDVVFISGLADEGACWADQVAGLGDRWRITTFDNRGVGQSETPAGEYRITSFAQDTAALMDALGIERAHVVGSSMGGAIAQELALAHPGKVRSLVLNGTYCRGDHFFREVIRSWQWAARKSDNLRDFLNVVNLWCFAPRIYNEGIMEEWLTAAAESPHAQSVDAFCRSADALIEHDSFDRVGAISVPTLVTVGALDLCLPERFGRELAGRIPGRDPEGHPRARPSAVPGRPRGVQRAARRVLVGRAGALSVHARGRSAQPLLEPLLGVGVVAEAGDVLVALAAVEPDRLGEHAVRLQVHDGGAGRPCVLLEHA